MKLKTKGSKVLVAVESTVGFLVKAPRDRRLSESEAEQIAAVLEKHYNNGSPFFARIEVLGDGPAISRKKVLDEVKQGRKQLAQEIKHALNKLDFQVKVW